MSQLRTSPNPDLARVAADGYELAVRYGHLVITGVPYVNSRKEVRLGTLVSDMSSISGDVTASPVQQHVAMWAGEHPCDASGVPLRYLQHSSNEQVLGPGLTVNHSFSSKPAEGYRDYHHKLTTYVSMIERHAQEIDSNVSARTHRFVESDDADSPFQYPDTASGRVGITNVARKLQLSRVGIFGVGGTGGYILDQVAKTPVREIAIFDDDTFLQHNAFRAPGAPSAEELRALPKKVHYFAGIYSRMHRGIVPHDFAISEETVGQVGHFDFAFICMDPGTPKRLLVEHLERHGIPFIDVGMGVELVDDALTGLLRVTTSTPQKRDHVRDKRRISFADGGKDQVYSSNIQIADLNAMNALLAVIRWKKLFGFYAADPTSEHYATYAISGNHITNEDKE
ncbi:MAG: ThiF family adenylyltransferase [Phenylobacterium sp.]|uniref:ThiF family adenylyltransferase n=1 Tax=Phenylobacterium sp. TaxID=1871053 RepID=UPI001A1C7828|nr:ThiF family adenylyltransferase [Phenylobacterium sp.]